MPERMRAAVIGGPSHLNQIYVRTVDRPPVGPNDVLVRVHSAALNYRDVKERREPPRPSSDPYIAGSDFAGEVVNTGSEVTGVDTGRHVVGLALAGACAEYVVTDASMVVAVPDALDLAIATAVTYAAAGGLGCYLGGLLHAAGVRTIGLTSNPTKAAVASQAGHTDIVLYRSTEPVEAVLSLTNGHGADIVFDSIGGPAFHRSFQMLANEGAVVLCGRTAGEPDLGTIQKELIDVRRNRSLRDFFLRTHIIDHFDQLSNRVDGLAGALASGVLTVPVTALPLDEIAAAYDLLESGATTGKLVIVPAQG
jgi:NADPH:quinone reductase